jgi:hypothetical protein
MKKHTIRLVLMTIMFLSLTLVCSGHAAPITGLFNTGVDDSNQVLGATAIDSHYRIIASSDSNGPNAYVTTDGNYPFGYWMPNNTSSKWIAPTKDTNAGYEFTYRTTFDLTGFNPTTALINGYGGTDDLGAIYLNGKYVCNINGFGSLTPFAISSGFVSGLNNLDFVVTNSGGGPTGLRVEFATATASPVPLPSALYLLAPGLLGLIGIKRKHLG